MKKEKRVGIVTFHGADNQGAVLQSYALLNTLKGFGLNAEIVNYSCDNVEKTKHSEIKFDNLKVLSKSIAMSVYYVIKRKGFSKFREKYLELSKKYNKTNISQCNKDYDVFLAGSDQIWNLQCSGNDYTYFLGFADDDKEKYSYAASLGDYIYSDEQSNKVNELIDGFIRVSVREASAVEQIDDEGKRKVFVHPDPVILLPREKYINIMSKRLCRKKYVFVYLVLPDVNVLKNAFDYANKNDFKVIINKKSPEFILHGSPTDFLSWIYYAEAVFTNSFHGTAFSVIFNKKLGADIQSVGGKTNNRVSEFLETVGAEKCILSKNGGKAKKPDVDNNLLELRSIGIKYLNTIFCDN